MTDLKRLNQPFTQTDINEWFTNVSKKHPLLNHTLLQTACQFIETHNTVTQTNHPTAQLGLAVADILLTMNSDTHSIVSALILPTISHQQIESSAISELFHRNITHLISGVKKIEEAEELHANKPIHHAEHIDNLRKMMLAIIDDARIVLLKFAKQIIELQRIKLADDTHKRSLARHTMDLYAPLANRLGMGQLKWQLEDFAFRYLEPETYSKLSKSLKLRRKERDRFINEMKTKLISLLQDADITDVDVSGRSKHIYSIHKKIERKQVPFDQIYDASALRILVPEIKDCYTTLGIIHAQWPPIKEEFDDYISQPKPNGYQSIHTAVIFHETLNVEIQIRTHDMHESAELGVAAHWKYKEGSTGKATYEDKIATLRQIIDWQKALSDDKPEQHNQEYTRLFEDRIYVFTPQGDVYDLPVNATPLDFAYYIHTEVGNRCKGAVINGKLEPLTQALKTGDRVEIKTGKVDQPSLDWLSPHTGYITTQQARQKIKAWFRRQDAARHLEMGEELWDKARKKHQLAKQSLEQVLDDFRYQTTDELLMHIGSGDVQVSTVIQHLQALTEVTEDSEASPLPISIQESHLPVKSKGSIEGVDDTLTTLARCCKPIPGDEIIGYVTKGRGISIHKVNCGNVQYALKKQPERLTKVSWRSQALSDYLLGLNIEAVDRPELLRDITNVMSKHQCHLNGMQSHVDTMTDIAYIQLSVAMKAPTEPQQLMNAIQHLEGIKLVKRK